jgi:hypothetical protein
MRWMAVRYATQAREGKAERRKKAESSGTYT